MRTLQVVLLSLCAACARSPSLELVGRADVSASAWPSEPIAAVMELNPWAMVLGADLPLVEIYSDGTVLRADPMSATDRGFLVSQLTAQEMKAIRSFLKSSSSFWELEEAYDLSPNVTDQPTTEVILAKEGRQKRVAVYGYSLGTVETPAFTRFPRSGNPDRLPGVLDRLARTLASVNPSNSVPWQPRYIEVMIWPYEYSPEEPIAWPSDWPAPESADVLPRGDSYSVILPGTELADLRMLVAQRREKQAVAFAGKKWAIAYRLVMPGGEVERRLIESRSKHGAQQLAPAVGRASPIRR